MEPTTLDKDLEITPQKELQGMAEAAWVVVCYPFSTISLREIAGINSIA